MDQTAERQLEKHKIRAEAHNRRRHQENADLLSRRIFEQLVRSDDYRLADRVLCYVSFRSEVSTRQFLAESLHDGKQVAVPFCVDDHLDLFWLEGLCDLSPGTLGILEPKPELRSRPERRAAVEQLDLVVVPGVAFDRRCGRLGYGKGYFDRLLWNARAETTLAAVAFDCQVFPEVPVLPHDVRVDKLITERGVYLRSEARHNHGRNAPHGVSQPSKVR
jgi:5-formyltetrahydrofolate cyclo-ligase